MRITIAGNGFVGRAHNELLKQRHEITISDPAFIEYAQGIPSDTEAVIICVATPQGSNGECVMDNVFNVIDASPDVPMLIKSTISIEGWRMLIDAFPNRKIAFSPEFLREASWLEDIMNLQTLLVGGKGTTIWANIFDIRTEVSDAEALILTKYTRNSFLALKVSFFNQIHDLCKELGVNYNAVAHYTGMDPRITESHTNVTEARGFGGHCFPKDTSALTTTAQRNNVNLSILEQAILYNKKIRKD